MLKPYSASSFCLPNKNRVGVAHGDGTNLEVVYKMKLTYFRRGTYLLVFTVTSLPFCEHSPAAGLFIFSYFFNLQLAFFCFCVCIFSVWNDEINHFSRDKGWERERETIGWYLGYYFISTKTTMMAQAHTEGRKPWPGRSRLSKWLGASCQSADGDEHDQPPQATRWASPRSHGPLLERTQSFHC